MNQYENINDNTQNNEKNGGDKFMFSLICKIDPLHIMRINFYSSTKDKEQQQQQQQQEKENHHYQNHSQSSSSSNKHRHRRRKNSKNNDLSI
jgi:hypothetical protein